MKLMLQTQRPEDRKSISSFDSESVELNEGEVKDLNLEIVKRNNKVVYFEPYIPKEQVFVHQASLPIPPDQEGKVERDIPLKYKSNPESSESSLIGCTSLPKSRTDGSKEEEKQ